MRAECHGPVAGSAIAWAPTRLIDMTVRRIMGTEVEYGISVPGQPQANPMVTSSQVVNAYGARPELTRGGRARWDYEEESPLRDARGFTYTGAVFDPAEALADEDLGLANVILTNGARLYVDHVTQANQGCDLDFLVGRTGSAVGRQSH